MKTTVPDHGYFTFSNGLGDLDFVVNAVAKNPELTLPIRIGHIIRQCHDYPVEYIAPLGVWKYTRLIKNLEVLRLSNMDDKDLEEWVFGNLSMLLKE